MKTINEYIDGIEVGDTVPAIKGEIVQVTPPKDDSTTQVVTIQSGERIKLYIKDASLHVPEPSVGNILSVACGKRSTGIVGITLKNNSAGKPYLTVSSGAIVSVTEQDNQPAQQQEPVTANDLRIQAYVEDRLYIFKKVRELVRVYNETEKDISDTFPHDKLSELATAVHIHIEKCGEKGRIAPTHTQRVRKELHAEKSSVTEKPKKKREEASNEEAQKSDGIDWRDYKHPKSGERLGDISPEKLKTQIAPWYYRTNTERLQPEVAEYHYYIGKAIQGHKLTPDAILEAYLDHYAKDVHPHSAALRTECIVKFCQGLVENKILKGNPLDDYKCTMDEFLSVIRDFKNLWTTLVEEESSDD